MTWREREEGGRQAKYEDDLRAAPHLVQGGGAEGACASIHAETSTCPVFRALPHLVVPPRESTFTLPHLPDPAS